jgi:hypothetical protein
VETAAAAARDAAAAAAVIDDPHACARAALLQGSVALAGGDVDTARRALTAALQAAERARGSRLVRQVRERLAELRE